MVFSGTAFFKHCVFLGPSALGAGHKSEEKRGFVTYSTDQKEEVSKIFIISLLGVTDGFGNDFCSRRMASNFRHTTKAKTSQFEIAFRSLACNNTQFRFKKF